MDFELFESLEDLGNLTPEKVAVAVREDETPDQSKMSHQ